MLPSLELADLEEEERFLFHCHVRSFLLVVLLWV